MPIELKCPNCGKRLRVGDNLAGVKVSCPSCKTGFVAPKPTPPEPVEEPLEAVKSPDVLPPPQKTPTIPVPESSEGYDIVGEDKPKKRSTVAEKPRDEESEGDDEPGAVDDDLPRPKKKKRRSRRQVAALLSFPATALKIVAWLGAGLSGLGICLVVVGILVLVARGESIPTPQGPQAINATGAGAAIVGLCVFFGIIVGWTRLLISAADAMYGVEGYWTAFLGSLAAVIPALLCAANALQGTFFGAILNLAWTGATVGAGAWALVLLCLPDVRNAFREAKPGGVAMPIITAVIVLPFCLLPPISLIARLVERSSQPTFNNDFVRTNPQPMPPTDIGKIGTNPQPNFPPPDFRPPDVPPRKDKGKDKEEKQPPPPVTGNAEIDRLLAELDNPKPGAVGRAADQLARMTPTAAERDQVAQKLASRVENADIFSRGAVVRALTVWGTKNEIPVLINILNDSNANNTFARYEVLRMIGKFQDARTLPAVMKCFKDFGTRNDATKALKDMGPMAEDEVLVCLNTNDANLRGASIRVLKEIGTVKSVPSLQAVIARRDPLNSALANDALITIAARNRK